MGFLRLFYIVASLAMVVGVSHADSAQERYWNAMLPNTRMPKFLVDLLHPNFMDDKSADVNVGKGGVNVDAGRGKPGGGANVGVGKGGVHVEAGKGKPGGGTNVGVGKGGVAVHTGHKGKPVYVGVKPGPNPFLYNYAATETQIHDDPNVARFFTEKELSPGKTMNLKFSARDSYAGTAFLPRQGAESMPFSSEKFPVILKTFSVKPGSDEAETMKNTIKECEASGLKGEKKICATSLESMVDFSISNLGKDRIQAVSTEVEKQNQKQSSSIQKYTIKSGAKKLADEKSVVCHKQNYPYAVFYCHKTESNSVYLVGLEGEDGTRAKAVAVCHKDTSAWNPNHLAFKVLNVKPGTVPICHFLPENHIVWFQN